MKPRLRVESPMLLCAAVLLLQGCVSHHSRNPAAVAHRRQTGEGCATADVRTRMHELTPAAFLGSGGKQLESWMMELKLQCPATYTLDDAYEAGCNQSIADVLVLVNRRMREPVSMADVRFDERAGCLDTFIVGCESWDCSRWLEVVVPTDQPVDATKP